MSVECSRNVETRYFETDRPTNVFLRLYLRVEESLPLLPFLSR
jgi:hypothetical protein